MLMSSSGSGGSPRLCRWVFSCVRLCTYWRGGDTQKKRDGTLEEGCGDNKSKYKLNSTEISNVKCNTVVRLEKKDRKGKGRSERGKEKYKRKRNIYCRKFWRESKEKARKKVFNTSGT